MKARFVRRGAPAMALVLAVSSPAAVAHAELGLGRTPAPALPGISVGTPEPPAAAAQAVHSVILELREGVSDCLSCEVALGHSIDGLVPGSRLGTVLARHGMRSMRPLRPAARGAIEPESRVQAAHRRAAVRTRFPSRSARAPRDAETPDFSRTYVVRLRSHPDMQAVARTIGADPAVAHCEPDGVMTATLVPNDPFYASQGSWGQTFDDLWGAKRVGAGPAWDTTRGAGVLVAVTDTGLDYTHPDIAANVWTNPGEIAGNALDDDGNGFVDDVHGYDFADGDADPLDDHGHGTHVSGTIAAAGDNGIGVVGVAYQSQVMAVRGLGRTGSGSFSDLADAILYAVDNGADIVNASWGGPFSQTVSDAIAAAHAAGVVFVAAAGNAQSDALAFAPASDRNAITVAAVDRLDARSYFSNYGIKIDVAAPGGGDEEPPKESQTPSYSILSLHSASIAAEDDYDGHLILSRPEAQYLRLAGTSMAAPHVSAVAALALAEDPTLTVEQVRQLLRTTADDVGDAGRDDDTGYGVVNAAAALSAPAPLEAHISAPANDKYVGHETLEITGSAGGPGFGSYTVSYRSAADLDAWTIIAGPIGTPASGGSLATWSVADLVDGDYVVRLTAERAGEQFTDEVRVTLANAQIRHPAALTAVRAQGSVDILGTAAGGGFTSYLLEYRRPAIDPALWRTDGIVPAGVQTTAVRNGVLGTLDVSGLTEGDRFDFRLTVTNAAGTLTKLRGGIPIDPTIRAGWPQPLVRVADAEYLTVADLDDDGIQEILVGSGSEVVVFAPDGTVRPGWPQSVATPSFPFVSTRGSPIVADIAGDDAPEVIATNRAEVLAWTGDGELLPGFPVTVQVLEHGLNDWLTAGDRDGDGKDDIVCSGVSGLQILRGDGTEVEPGDSSIFGVAASAVADVVGDPRAEIARYDRYASKKGLMELLGANSLTLAESRERAQTFTHVSMADMNGDGVLEMITVRENDGKTRMRLNTIDATGERVKTAAPKTVSGSSAGATGGQVSYADVDDDGVVEAWAYVTQARPDYFTDGTGFFVAFEDRYARSLRAPLSHSFFEYVDAGGIAVGDVDGDGEQEIVGGVSGVGCGRESCRPWVGEYAPVRRGVVIQKLDGSLLPAFPKTLPQAVAGDDGLGGGISITFGLDDRRYGTPAIADLDGDGLKEVLWVDPATRQLWVWDVAGTPGPLRADWPAYHGDPKHSNVFPVGGR